MMFLGNWWLLVCRNVRVLLATKASVLWVLLQPPLLGALIFIGFAGYAVDDAPLDFFSRFTVHSRNYMDWLDKAGQSPSFSKDMGAMLYLDSQRSSWAREQAIGVGTAQRRAAVHYLLISAAIWFGLVGACTEIAGEQHVLFRESRSCYGCASYLAAKFTVQSIVVGLQVALLLICVLLAFPVFLQTPLLDLSSKALTGECLLLWLVAMAAASMGLLLSASCSSVQGALTWVPVLMIPQFLFGGLLRPLPMMVDETAPWKLELTADEKAPALVGNARSVLSCLVLQRWGFDGAMSLDDAYAVKGVLSVRLAWPDVTGTGPKWYPETLLRVVNCREMSLADTVLAGKSPVDPLARVTANSQTGGMGSRDRLKRAVLVLLAEVGLMLSSALGILTIRLR